MDDRDMTMKGNVEGGGSGRFPLIVLAVVVAVAALAVVIDDATRLLAYLPWLLLAACPLMHVFMHRGRRHEGHARHEADDTAATMRNPRRPAGGESR